MAAGDWTGTINGLSIGPGTNYPVAGVTGWETQDSMPLGGASGQVTPKMSRNGSWLAPFWQPTRTVTLSLEVQGSVSTPFKTAIQNLLAATPPSGTQTIPLSLQLDGVATTLNCVVAKRNVVTDLAYQAGLAVVSIEFIAFDPRRLGTAVSASTGLPSSSGGLTWPVSWPISWTSTITTGSVQLTNAGNAAGPLTVTFYGGSSGVSGPSIGQTESGLTLSFSSALTIQPNDQLVVDMDARTALYNGQASRANYLVSRGWQTFLPGTNTFTFNATSAFNAAPSMTVTGTPAYL